jgi:hypothetical protein
MTLPDALQVLVLAHTKGAQEGDYPRIKDYFEEVRTAFVGSDTNCLVRELGLLDEKGTGAGIRLFYLRGEGESPASPPGEADLNLAIHTLVVIFVTRPLINDDASMQALEGLAARAADSEGRHGLILLGTSEEVLRDFRGAVRQPSVKALQGWSLEKLGEYALRPAYVTILTLFKAHQLLLAGATGKSSVRTPKARFFVSHSKLDGLPLAYSLCHTIKLMPWLEYFYDAEDIHPGEDFRKVLEEGVIESMLLVLRTDIYDLRFWCRQEIMWAEMYDRPVLLVDARTELFSRPSALGFTGIPGVRIPDGNLVRVLLEGLREWVRIAVARRRFSEIIRVNPALDQQTEFLCRTPSTTALLAARARLLAKGAASNAILVHAEPALESNYLEAARDMMQSRLPKASVVPFKTFVAQIP